MSATETVKEIVRIANTAGLAKDVIDLLQVKAALLTEQVATLEEDHTTLSSENRNLKLENETLLKQLQNARPYADRLDETTEKILKYAFEQTRDLSAPHIASVFKMKQGVADFHIGELRDKDFISWKTFGSSGTLGDESALPEFTITAEGQKYIVKNGLAA
jgi:regulator of replication initiation timing